MAIRVVYNVAITVIAKDVISEQENASYVM